MEWLKTLSWIVRGSPRSFVVTLALFAAIFVLVPLETGAAKTGGFTAAGVGVAE